MMVSNADEEPSMPDITTAIVGPWPCDVCSRPHLVPLCLLSLSRQ